MLSIASKAIASAYKFLSPTKQTSAVLQNMETYASRLNSFESARSVAKTRTSNAKNSKVGKWPHKSPSPSQLARAGFFFEPSPSSPDNVTCATCLKSLDGWEPNDDPIKEHLAYSPDCGIAVHASLEQELEAGNHDLEHPMSERMINARKMTFGELWPHERKRGWSCKIQKMIEAGWYYCPTPDSDDFVKCAYCSLSLDGWEPKDKPFEEHQRRSADCLFFTLGQPTKVKTTKTRKGRSSKASRLSTQSTQTTFTEDVAMIDDQLEVAETSILDDAKLSGAPAVPNKEKKNGRPKKGASKTKAGTTLGQSPSNTKSDELEAKADEEPKSRKRGKKRASELMSTEEVDAAPAAKRRGTRTRSSTVKPESFLAAEQAVDTHMIDVDEPSTYSTSYEPKGKKRASKDRKASNLSTASKASLRSRAPADDEIDAVLEAELDQPLSEEDSCTKLRKKTSRNKQGSQKTSASTAPIGRNRYNNITTESSDPQDEVDNYIGSRQHIDEAKEVIDDDAAALDLHITPIVNPKARKGSKAKSTDDIQETAVAEKLSTTSQPEENLAGVGPKSTRGKSRQASRQVSKQKGSGPQQSSSAPIVSEDSSVLTTGTSMATDEVGEISDASHATVKRGRTASRTASSTAKKRGRKPKVTTTRVNAEVAQQIPSETNDSHTDLLVDVDTGEPTMPVTQAVDSENKKPKAPRGRPKAKKASSLDPSANHAEEIKSQKEQTQSTIPQDGEKRFELHNTVQASDLEGQDGTKKSDSCGIVASQRESPPAQRMISPTPSPQSSDAENQPPSSRPSAMRPPLGQVSPSRANTTRVQIAASTPAGVSKSSSDGLETSFPWTAIEIEDVLAEASVSHDKIRILNFQSSIADEGQSMTVEEWILYQAKMGEEKIKNECEMIVGKFESEGVRALKVLEGIVTCDSAE